MNQSLLRKKIINEIQENIEKLYIKSQTVFSIEDFGDILLFYSELLNLESLEDKNEEIYNFLQFLLLKLKNEPEKYLLPFETSMLRKTGQITFAINTITCKTGEYKKVSYSTNKLLLNSLYEKVKKSDENKVFYGTYDIVSGISGCLYYLLDCECLYSSKENKEKAIYIIKYLINLTNKYQYKGKTIIKYHVKKKYQYLEKEKINMPDGHINMGFAHGIAGPLVVLAKAKNRGFYVEGIDNAIETIINLYEKFSTREQGILKYPRKLPVEDYCNNRVSDLNVNVGWCYGNLSIIRALMKTGIYLERGNFYTYYEQEFLKILKMPIEYYNLSSPILCHGYGSLISLQMGAFYDYCNADFLVNIDRNLHEMLQKYINRKEMYEKYVDNISFLTGTVGINLALLNGIKEKVTYNKLMLID